LFPDRLEIGRAALQLGELELQHVAPLRSLVVVLDTH
jgi:hypothetical protein